MLFVGQTNEKTWKISMKCEVWIRFFVEWLDGGSHSKQNTGSCFDTQNELNMLNIYNNVLIEKNEKWMQENLHD